MRGVCTDCATAILPKSEVARLEQEEQNCSTTARKLPVEILSQIFIVGQAMDLEDDSEARDKSIPRSRWRQHPEFQDIVARVCHQWRAVAVSTPIVCPVTSQHTEIIVIGGSQLWRCINLSQKSVSRAVLFPERCGNIVSLDVEIVIQEMSFKSNTNTEGFHRPEFHIELQSRFAQEALEFIISHGGAPSRWARLAFWFQTTTAMFTAIDFIMDADLHNLRELSLVNDYNDPIKEETFQAIHGRDFARSGSLKTLPPPLSRLDLVAIPSQFLFARSGTPLVSNLVHLRLAPLVQLPSLEGLYGLLLSNPRLESLCLEMGMIETLEYDDDEPSGTRASLPYLLRFSLQEPVVIEWALSVLGMVDAPGLQEFRLGFNTTEPEIGVDLLTYYITNGRVDGELVYVVDDIGTTWGEYGPIYPSLKYMALGPYFPESSFVKDLLESFDQVQRIDWDVEEGDDISLSLNILATPTATVMLCPKLEHLRVSKCSEEWLVKVVHWRKRHGCPLRVVEVASRTWCRISEGGMAFLRKHLERFEPYIDGTEWLGGFEDEANAGSTSADTDDAHSTDSVTDASTDDDV